MKTGDDLAWWPVPMPNAQIAEGDLKRIVGWVLQQ
jgi:hypothetical protein